MTEYDIILTNGHIVGMEILRRFPVAIENEVFG